MNKRGCGVPKLECPKCGEFIISTVIDTVHKDNVIRRIRQCEECGVKFVTHETIVCTVRRRKQVNDYV